jgi:hypothetical protein
MTTTVAGQVNKYGQYQDTPTPPSAASVALRPPITYNYQTGETTYQTSPSQTTTVTVPKPEEKVVITTGTSSVQVPVSRLQQANQSVLNPSGQSIEQKIVSAGGSGYATNPTTQNPTVSKPVQINLAQNYNSPVTNMDTQRFVSVQEKTAYERQHISPGMAALAIAPAAIAVAPIIGASVIPVVTTAATGAVAKVSSEVGPMLADTGGKISAGQLPRIGSEIVGTGIKAGSEVFSKGAGFAVSHPYQAMAATLGTGLVASPIAREYFISAQPEKYRNLMQSDIGKQDIAAAEGYVQTEAQKRGLAQGFFYNLDFGALPASTPVLGAESLNQRQDFDSYLRSKGYDESAIAAFHKVRTQSQATNFGIAAFSQIGTEFLAVKAIGVPFVKSLGAKAGNIGFKEAFKSAIPTAKKFALIGAGEGVVLEAQQNISRGIPLKAENLAFAGIVSAGTSALFGVPILAGSVTKGTIGKGIGGLFYGAGSALDFPELFADRAAGAVEKAAATNAKVFIPNLTFNLGTSTITPSGSNTATPTSSTTATPTSTTTATPTSTTTNTSTSTTTNTSTNTSTFTDTFTYSPTNTTTSTFTNTFSPSPTSTSTITPGVLPFPFFGLPLGSGQKAQARSGKKKYYNEFSVATNAFIGLNAGMFPVSQVIKRPRKSKKNKLKLPKGKMINPNFKGGLLRKRTSIRLF